MGLQEESDTTYQLNHELLSCYLVVLVLYGNYIKGYIADAITVAPELLS